MEEKILNEYEKIKDKISKEDFLKVAEKVDIKKVDALKCIEEVLDSVSKWEEFAREAGLSKSNCQRVKKEIMNR